MIGGHPKILVIRLSAIGDVVRVLPAVAALRNAFPSAQIDWAVENTAADILRENPLLDRLFVFDRGPRWLQSALLFWNLMRRLRDQQYDIAIDFHGIFKSGLLLRATQAPRRIAFAPPRAREGSHRFANEWAMLSAPIMNRVDENLELCSTITGDNEPIRYHFQIDKQINVDVFRTVTEQRKNRPWLALVHAPVDRPEKRWPAERFAKLIDMLMEDGRFDVVLTHGPGQRQMLTTILLKCKHEPIVPPQCESLREFAGLASKASLYIGTDTGPMHIAAAVGTPVVAVFGGTSPLMHSPVGASSRVLGGVTLGDRMDRVSLEASVDVLEAVKMEEVYAAAVELLNQSGVPHHL